MSHRYSQFALVLSPNDETKQYGQSSIRRCTIHISRDAVAADPSLLHRRPWRRRRLATAAVRRLQRQRHRCAYSGRDRSQAPESDGRRVAKMSRSGTGRTSHAGLLATRGSDWRRRTLHETQTAPSNVAFWQQSQNRQVYNCEPYH